MRSIASQLKAIARRVHSMVRAPLDLVLAILSIPSAGVFWVFRREGAERMPITRDLLRSLGVFPIRRHYYEPLFDTRHLAHDLAEDRALPGIDIDPEGQLRLLRELDYVSELQAPGWAGTYLGPEFELSKGAFLSGDAEFLYAFLRHLKPRRVFEIGSGMSTRIARQALVKNQAETGRSVRHVCIEPYEMPWLEEVEGLEVVRRKVEDCPLGFFRELEAGDLLFIDSSHIIRPQGDVLFEYLSLLPALKSGTFVHVHDIFTPRDYPEEWVKDGVSFWNEQYLLEALLSNSPRYKVVAALNYLKKHHFDRLRAVCPFLSKDREPGSFYLTIR
jgi:hypothetical protein